jgi:uncharacterized FlaG/YvyC family protein
MPIAPMWGQAMDNGVSIRPVQPSSTMPSRTDYAPERQTVRTELPEVAAVTPPAATFDARGQDAQRSLRAELSTAFEGKQRAVLNTDTQRRVAYNTEAREVVVYRVDANTGSVINQFPDDALLRQKAYVKAAQDKDETAQSCRECNVTKVA